METNARYEYALVGGGLASVWAAQTIRERDQQGRIVILGDEPHPPYDRPPFSKNFLTDDAMTPDDGYSKYDDFYPKNHIDLRISTRVTAIDRNERALNLDTGSSITYEKLLLATGASARRPPIPGSTRSDVFTLRRIEDSIAIREALERSKRLTIVGGGYIGLEVAAGARSRGLEVTVIESMAEPWTHVAGQEFGAVVRRYYEGKGVRFILDDSAVSIDGQGVDGPPAVVNTRAGRRVEADMVLIAVGAVLNTDLATQSRLDVDPASGIKVDQFLQTSDPTIWAAGDVACFNDVATGNVWHLEHFLNAKWQGQAAGANMSGDHRAYDQIPYFFSDEFDIHMVLRGDNAAGRQSLVAGDTESAEFISLYHDNGGRLTMGIAVSHDEARLDPISDALERLIRARVNIRDRAADVRKPDFDITSLA